MSTTSKETPGHAPLSVSVVIPTYRRPSALLKCVDSILTGSRRPAEIVIVGREGDHETREAIAKIENASDGVVSIRPAWVSVPGHVPPVETGARAASHELVAVLDDDVTVTTDWLFSMARHFSNQTIGVVGGRVLVPGHPVPKVRGKPGCISWYGKSWGNLGSLNGPSTFEVDSVMEGNCMWRRELLTSLEFDPLLNFDDGMMYGLDLCMQAKNRAFHVIYDPSALVHHHVSRRTPELDRQKRGPRLFSYCRNHTYIILKWFPLGRKIMFLGWWFLIGERGGWGLGAVVADTIRGRFQWRGQALAAMAGKIEGLRLWLSPVDRT